MHFICGCYSSMIKKKKKGIKINQEHLFIQKTIKYELHFLLVFWRTQNKIKFSEFRYVCFEIFTPLLKLINFTFKNVSVENKHSHFDNLFIEF